jgi:hypothetical protein
MQIGLKAFSKVNNRASIRSDLMDGFLRFIKIKATPTCGTFQVIVTDKFTNEDEVPRGSEATLSLSCDGQREHNL